MILIQHNMNVKLTLDALAGADLDSFDLYSNVDSYAVKFNASPISRVSLLDGYTTNVAPAGTTIIRVRSTGSCTNYYDANILLISPFITMSSHSSSSDWGPDWVENTGTTLDWTVSGGVTIAKTTIDFAVFDFSMNTGVANILIENIDNFTILQIPNRQLITLNISNSYLVAVNCFTNSLVELNTYNSLFLETLACYNNTLSSLDVRTNTALKNLYCNSNYIPSLDISLNTNLKLLQCQQNNQAPAATDQIFIDLDINGVTNGSLQIRNNRTSASDAARVNLITKGWYINDTFTS